MKTYNEDFKLRLVQLYNAGKSAEELSREFEVSKPTLYSWIKKYNNVDKAKLEESPQLTEIELANIELKKKLERSEMELDKLCASGADNGTKEIVISANKHKYQITDMCEFLKISRSYYYKLVKLRLAIKNKLIDEEDSRIDERIIAINTTNKHYGSRKISALLRREGINLTHYKVLKRMKKLGISSLYNVRKRFKPYGNNNSEATVKLANLVDQQFSPQKEREVITSDLTYIKFKNKFLYICFVIDLYNREIITYSTGEKHDAELVISALNNINMKTVTIFHSDRGKEFINDKIGKLLLINDVLQSVSKPGCPYDNAVSENLFGIFKREWMKQNYDSLKELEDDVAEFVHNYNYFRIHSRLNYQSPIEYRLGQ